MENTALLLIIITLLLLVIILGLLSFMVFKLLKDKNNSSSIKEENSNTRNDFHPEIVARMKEAEKIKAKRADLFCPNHTEEPGETVCAICDKLYCRACIRPFKSMHLCKEHLPLLMKNDWAEVFTIKTSTNDPESGVRLYEHKKKIFENVQLPTYIETHYKINVDDDYIETFLVLFAIRDEIEKVKENFSQFIE